MPAHWIGCLPARCNRLRFASLLRTQGKRLECWRPPIDPYSRIALPLCKLSNRFGNCWVVLKGHQTLVGRNIGDVSVNSSGNPYLAQGGSGDVLAGFLSGLLAQPGLQVDPADTIRYATWLMELPPMF